MTYFIIGFLIFCLVGSLLYIASVSRENKNLKGEYSKLEGKNKSLRIDNGFLRIEKDSKTKTQ